MEGITLFIYTALILAGFIEASPYTQCCDYKVDSERTTRLPRQVPFIAGNPHYLSPETDPFTTSVRSFGLIVPPPINNDEPGAMKAYSCSLMNCGPENLTGVVCACNFNTGNVVSFKNECDVLKHNCRFDTEFRVILHEICPWEFQSRRDNKPMEFDYSNPKYYN